MRFRRSRSSGAVHSDGGSGFPLCEMCGMAGPVDLAGHCLLGHYVGVAPRPAEPHDSDAVAQAEPDAEHHYHPHDDILSWQDLNADAEAAPAAAPAAGTPSSSAPAKGLDDLPWDDSAHGSSTLDYAVDERTPGAGGEAVAHQDGASDGEDVPATAAELSEGADELHHDDGADEEDARHARRHVAGIVGVTAAATAITAAAVLALPF
ncbi:hypothetical protein BH20ACT7_BH20ACT7_02840 [soil metagenome]